MIAYINIFNNKRYHKNIKKLKFEFYKRINGRVEFLEFLNHLEKKDRAKLLAIIDKIFTYGISTGIQQNWVKFIETNLFEIRSKVGKNQQRGLYFHVDGPNYIITHGFSKKTQKAPQSEIEHAKKLRAEYFKRKKNDNE